VPEPEARGQKPEARGQRPGARGQRPGARSQRPEARGQRPGARSQRSEARNSVISRFLLFSMIKIERVSNPADNVVLGLLQDHVNLTKIWEHGVSVAY